MEAIAASVESAPVTKAPNAQRQPSKTPAKAKAVETCVPLIMARPSFAPKTKGFRPIFFKASIPEMVCSRKTASPSPIKTAVMCASGARSPDAPTDPCDGITGVTPFFSKAPICSITSQRTPEAPLPKESIFSVITRRTMFCGRGSPTPQQWERIRLRCKRAVCSVGIRIPANLPNPVLIP